MVAQLPVMEPVTPSHGRPALQPTSDSDRHAILAVLRGSALYGVLLAHQVWLTPTWC